MLDSRQTAEFVRLWTLHGQRVYAYLLMLLSNDADADELYQEVGMTLWEKFEQFVSGTNFQAWARCVALNKVRNFRQLRRHNTALCSPEFFEAVDQAIAEDAGELEAQHRVLADCLRRLRPRQRDLIEQRYRPGATPTSVASQTGRSVKAVYEALRRVHNALLDCVRKAALGEGMS
jgi:RNA polymerase sigma-70 factor, ECF subfamily